MARVTITFTYEGDGKGNVFVIDDTYNLKPLQQMYEWLASVSVLDDDESEARDDHERSRGEVW